MSQLLYLQNGGEAIVSDYDYDKVADLRWFTNGCGYAATPLNSKWALLHRVVMNAQSGSLIDHINRNKLDCRRENLRFCTRAQNAANASRKKNGKCMYKGVSQLRKRFVASICCNKKVKHLGVFDTQEEAAMAYNAAAATLFGSFANPNQI